MYVANASHSRDNIMPFQYVSTPKSFEEGRCKKVAETNYLKIANAGAHQFSKCDRYAGNRQEYANAEK